MAEASSNDGGLGFRREGFIPNIFHPCDFVESELEVDDGEEESEQPVEAKVDGFAAVVVLNEFFAEFIKDNDP
jgi:hypothetical protein